jgi:TonB family protein
MKPLISLLGSVFLTILIFLFLADINIAKINIRDLSKKTTKFYTIYKPKKVSEKKPIKQKKKIKKIKKKLRRKPKVRLAKKIIKKIKSDIKPKLKKKTQEIIDIDDLEQEVVVIEKVIPAYPEIAHKAGVECSLLLEVIVNEKGRVEDANVVYSSQPGYGFEQSALKAVRKLRFKPFEINGEKVKVKIVYPIDFILVE